MSQYVFPRDFETSEPVSSICQKVPSPFKEWLQIVYNKFKEGVIKALMFAKNTRLFDDIKFYSDISQLENRIVNCPFSDYLAAYSYPSFFYFSIKNILEMVFRNYSQYLYHGLTHSLGIVEYTGFHEAGHHVFQNFRNRGPITIYEAIIDEAFAEFYAWKAIPILGSDETKRYLQNYLNYIYNNYISFTSQNEEIKSFAILLNLYLGDTLGVVNYHRNNYSILNNFVNKLKNLIRSYIIKIKNKENVKNELLYTINQIYKTLNSIKLFSSELCFVKEETQTDLVDKILSELIICKTSFEKILSKNSLNIKDIIKIYFIVSKFLKIYKKYISVLDSLITYFKNLGFYNAINRITAKYYYFTWYGKSYEINLGKNKTIIKAPDLGHIVGIRLAYKWLRERKEPREILMLTISNFQTLFSEAQREVYSFFYDIYANFLGKYKINHL